MNHYSDCWIIYLWANYHEIDIVICVKPEK